METMDKEKLRKILEGTEPAKDNDEWAESQDRANEILPDPEKEARLNKMRDLAKKAAKKFDESRPMKGAVDD